MELKYNSKYPSIESLREKARKRVPGFAFQYLDRGCNEETNLRKNTEAIREIELIPYYLREAPNVSLKTELFGEEYNAPFGIAPVGLQGMIWPKAPEILAKAAYEYNIPYCLSTVSTASIETIGEITHGKAWFQLYNPQEDALRNDLLDRLKQSGYKTLVILADVPSFGYRHSEIKNGLSMPPKMTLNNFLQVGMSPQWALKTLIAGQPEFKSLKKYMQNRMNLKHLGLFMNKTFNGRLTEDKVKAIRDKWDGNLVIKGVSSEEDAEKCIQLGLDGIWVSNHGGRQLDAGESSVASLDRVNSVAKGKAKIMMDSGIRTGPDIASTMSKGADFTFLGRSFMYGVGALGSQGGSHTISILMRQLQQVMDQCGCETPTMFPNYKV
jgi:L-lactate dehydrogenase (cytochrome)